MAMVIGTVSKIVGMAVVVDEQGKRHLVKTGDELHAGERLITAPGATVSMQMVTGETVNFYEKQTVKLTDQLAEAGGVDAGVNAVNQAVLQQIIAAINTGQDITALLDPTGAGVESDGNATFVNLDRISTSVGANNLLDGGRAGAASIEEVKPANYSYNLATSIITPPPPPPPPPRRQGRSACSLASCHRGRRDPRPHLRRARSHRCRTTRRARRRLTPRSRRQRRPRHRRRRKRWSCASASWRRCPRSRNS